MSQLNDNPGQGNHGGQEYGEEGTHKSQRNQDNQPTNTTSEEKALRPEEEVPSEDKKRDKFSPGEADNYNPEEFATD
jgi:hypothetical protein